MSNQHSGNTQPSISQEEHDHNVNPATKRVLPYGYDGTNKNLLFVDDQGVQRSIVTIASAISTTLSGNMTLNPSPNFIGLTTTVIGSAPTIFAVVNTAAAGQSSVVLDTGTKWIGLATTTIGSSPTLYAVVNTSAPGTTNSLTTLLNSSAFIGLVTVANTVPVTGTFWQTTQPVSLVGQATLNASSNFIGLVSTASIQGKMTIVDATGAEMDLFKQGDNFAVGGDHGLMILSIDDGTPNKYQPLRSHATIADNSSNDLPRLAVIASNKVYNGTGWDRMRGNTTGVYTVPKGNATLNPSSAWIGLATVMQDYGSNVTVHTGVYSATGTATVFIAPASNRFWLTSLHMSSLGRSEVEIRSGATTLIPFTSLATTGGYVHDFAPPGLPSRAQADAFVVNLNGAATVAVMASWYARP